MTFFDLSFGSFFSFFFIVLGATLAGAAAAGALVFGAC